MSDEYAVALARQCLADATDSILLPRDPVTAIRGHGYHSRSVVPPHAHGFVICATAETPVLRYELTIVSNTGCISWNSGSTLHVATRVYVVPEGMMATRNCRGRLLAFVEVPRKENSKADLPSILAGDAESSL